MLFMLTKITKIDSFTRGAEYIPTLALTSVGHCMHVVTNGYSNAETEAKLNAGLDNEVMLHAPSFLAVSAPRYPIVLKYMALSEDENTMDCVPL